MGGSGAQALHDAALALEAAEAELRLKRGVSVHVGELGESLRQLVRLGLGETVVGGVEVVVNWIFRLYFLYPACISLYPDIFIYLYLAPFCSISVVSHCIPLYPLYLAYFALHPAVSAVSRCISLYLTVSHRFENGI